MAGEAPVYLSRAPTQGLGQVSPVDTVGGERTASALQGLGQTVAQTGLGLAEIGREVDLSRRKTGYLQGLDALHQEAEKDPDPAGAAQRFQDRAKALAEQQFAGLSPSDRARADLWATPRALTGLGEVRRFSLGRQRSQFAADLDAQGLEHFKRYAGAASDVERATIRQGYFDTLDEGVRNGMLLPDAAQRQRRAFETTLTGAELAKRIDADPAGAQRDLADPAKYPELDPAQRQQALVQARTAADERRTFELRNQAQHNPIAALATVGRASPQDAAALFARSIAPVEGGTTMVEGERVGLTSKKGALGLGQIMPGTAREMAQDFGRTDLLGLSDQALRERLLADHALNEQLSVGYLAKNLRRFEGSIPAAFAAYHAGPGAVDTAYRSAVAKYGAHFSAEQFAGELSPKLHDGNMSTADYVRRAYAKLGANPNGAGLSINAAYRAQSIVEAQASADRTAQTQLLRSMIEAQAGERDQMVKNIWDGYRIDPSSFAAARAPLAAAAAGGDGAAATKLRALDFAGAAGPAIAEARRMAPAALAEALDREEQGFLVAPPSEFQAARHKAMRAVQSEQVKALAEFPTAILRGQGVAPVIGLDPSAGPNDPGFVQALAARGAQAEAAARIPGAQLKPFAPEEVAAFKARLAQGSEEDRLGLIATLGATLSPAAQAAATRQLFGDDAAARVAGRLAGVDMGLARDALRGAKLLDLPEMKERGPELREALRRVMPADLWPDPATQDDAIRAAMAVYAAERGRQGLLYETPDRRGLEAAMTRVAGEFTTRGGKRVAVPRGLPVAVFERALDGLTEADLAPFGGASWSVDPKPGRDAEAIDPAFLGREASLTQIDLGSSLYGVTRPIGGGRHAPVMTADGRPLVIDMAAIARRRNPAPPGPAGLAGALAAEAALGDALPTPREPFAPPAPGGFTPFRPDPSALR